MHSEKPLLIANWKMYLTYAKARALARAVRTLSENKEHHFASSSVVVCPSFESLAICASELGGGRKAHIQLGAQDCSWASSGAHTGEVSSDSLSQLGCTYCIIGHSERRTQLGESDEMIAKKTDYVLNATSLTPILCVGESLRERNLGVYKKVIRKQLQSALSKIHITKQKTIVIAYEPVWAIGTGLPIEPKDCAVMYEYCMNILRTMLSGDVIIRFIYGGSVTSKNSAEFVKPGIAQGALVGSASVDAKEFARIIRSAKQSYRI